MITIESQDKKVFGDFETVFLQDGVIYSYTNGYKDKVILGKYSSDRAVEVYKDIKMAAINGSAFDEMQGKIRTIKYNLFEMPQI